MQNPSVKSGGFLLLLCLGNDWKIAGDFDKIFTIKFKVLLVISRVFTD